MTLIRRRMGPAAGIEARPHRTLGLQTPVARSDSVLTAGPLTCTERLGGLSREDAREQAPAAA